MINTRAIPGVLSFIAVLAAVSSAVAQTQENVRIPVVFTAPSIGFASLALYGQDGVLVRSLLYAAPVEKGRQTIQWDGTTDMGKPAVPGVYTARGVFFTTPPALNLVMEVGKSGNPPWRTPDGKGDWGANMGAPTSIVSNGKSVIMAYVCVEDNQVTGIQQMDGGGGIQTRYFSFYGWDTRMAAAMDDANYYLGILNGDKKQIEIASYRVGEPRGKILVALPSKPHQDQTETRWKGRWTAWLDGLALNGDTLFASVAADDALFIIDRNSGQIRKQISIPSPHGLAVMGDRLLVVSGDKLLRLTLDGQVESTVIDSGILASPGAIALDHVGNTYIGDSGAAGAAFPRATLVSRQVLVFSPAGKLLRKIGKPGGTPDNGRFDANGLGTIMSLCIGPGAAEEPALWVNDVATGFFRTSRWSLDGQLERQWFGRRLSLYSDIINPAQPHELVYGAGAFSDEPGIYGYEMDIRKKTWQPSWHYASTWDDLYQENTYLSFKHGGNPFNGIREKEARWPVFSYESRHFVTHGGRNYFMGEGGNGDSPIFLYSADHKPIPVALIGNHRTQKNPDGKFESFYDQGPNNWFTWADRNNDGKMSTDEIIFTANPPAMEKTSRLSEADLDDQLNVHIKRWRGNVPVDSILPVKEVLPNGAPVYDWSMMRDLPPLQAPDLSGGDGTKQIGEVSMPVPLETEDAFYSMVQPGPKEALNLPGIDGQGWWASRNWRTKVARFDKTTGRCVWAVGRRAPGKAERGQMYHPAALAGVAGDAVFVTDTLGPVWVWNKDGLFLGNIYHDFSSGIQDDKTLYGEIQATGIYTDPQTHKIYSIANDTGAHIHEVILPALTPVNAGRITLTSTLAARALSWDPDGPAPTEHPRYAAEFVPHPIKIDGDLGDWFISDHDPMPPAALILMDGLRVATVRALYDAQNLYLAYDVSAPNGPVNAGSELPYSPFVSGAYVDFSIGPDWQRTRSEVREGDLRVILARITEAAGTKDFQQGFWQKKASGANGHTVVSPAASVHFDQVAEVPGLQMAYKVGEKDGKTGAVHYTVEVAVPLASLGLHDPAGKSIGFDASVGIANATGDRRERAAHWGGQSEAVVVDRPGSTRLLPDTWGTLVFGPAR